MHKKLFIPGPIEVSQDVLDKMAMPMIGHRTKDASALQQSISEKLLKDYEQKPIMVMPEDPLFQMDE